MKIRPNELVAFEALVMEMDIIIGEHVYGLNPKREFCIGGYKETRIGEKPVWRRMEWRIGDFIQFCRTEMTEEQRAEIEARIDAAR